MKYLSGICLFGAMFTVPRVSLAAEFEGNLEKTFSLSGAGKLSIDADRGTITIKTSGADKVEAHVFRKVKGGSKEKADELFKNHEVTFSQDGNNVSIVAKYKSARHLISFGGPNLEVRYEITIPKKFDVDLHTSGGDISVSDLDGNAGTKTSSGSIKLASLSGSVNATDSGGDISVGQAGGALAAHTSSGSILVGKAKAAVELSNSGGNIEIGEAAADVAASTSSGSIKLSNAGGSVKAKNSGGDISLGSVSGNVTAATSSGSIHIGKVKGEQATLRDSGGNIEIGEALGINAETSSGSIKIKTAHGPLELKNSGGDIVIGDAANTVTASTSSGSIKLKAARGAVDLRNSGGDIAVEDADGDATLSTSSGSIHIGRVKGKVEAKDSGGSIIISEAHNHVLAHTSSGDITVNFSDSPKAESRLEVSGGGVKVALPRAAGFDIDARSSGGDVVSSIPVTTVTHGGNQHGALQGKINGGGPSLILRSSSGDVRITENGTVKAEAEK